MKKNLLLWCCMTLLCVSCGKRITKTDLVGIVPKPVSEQLLDGTFDLNRHTKIRLLANDSMLMRSVDFFNGVVEPSLGKSLKAVQASVKQDKAINVWIEDSLEAEGYRLTIQPESIDIAGGSPAGVFYAFQTEAVVLPQIVSIKQASQRMGLPEYYIRRLCREVPGMAFQSGIKWYINLGKMADYFNSGTTTL